MTPLTYKSGKLIGKTEAAKILGVSEWMLGKMRRDETLPKSCVVEFSPRSFKYYEGGLRLFLEKKSYSGHKPARRRTTKQQEARS